MHLFFSKFFRLRGSYPSDRRIPKNNPELMTSNVLEVGMLYNEPCFGKYPSLHKYYYSSTLPFLVFTLKPIIINVISCFYYELSEQVVFVSRASEVCSDSIKKAVALLMLRATGAHERRGPGHNLRITPRATPGGPPPAAPTCSRRGIASGRNHPSQSHKELNRDLPDHGLAESRAVRLAVTAQRYSMTRSDEMLMAGQVQ